MSFCPSNIVSCVTVYSQSLLVLTLGFTLFLAAMYVTISQVVLVYVILVYAASVCLVNMLAKILRKFAIMVRSHFSGLALLNSWHCHMKQTELWTPL
ncbi:hypothetical protein VNO77_10797 [Canavalia gladiata]|uniref:Uncharacterized protein n=1 Tax=Canavalia gladiata TaxID=3824 RepID=A0AAN9MC74_CANGL